MKLNNLKQALTARSWTAINSSFTCLANNRKRTLDEEAAHKGTPLKQSPSEAQVSHYETEHQMRLRMADLLTSADATPDLMPEEMKLLRRLVVDEASRDQTAAEMKRSVSWISKRLKKIKGKIKASERIRRVLEADM